MHRNACRLKSGGGCHTLVDMGGGMGEFWIRQTACKGQRRLEGPGDSRRTLDVSLKFSKKSMKNYNFKPTFSILANFFMKFCNFFENFKTH